MSIRLHMKYPTEHIEAASSIARGNYRSDPANVKIDNPIMSDATDEAETFSFYRIIYGADKMKAVNLEVRYSSKYTAHTQKFDGYICRNTPDRDSIFLEFTGTIYRPHKITGAIAAFNIHSDTLYSDPNIIRNNQNPATFNLTFKDNTTNVIKIHGFGLHQADTENFSIDTE
jgi:hypothetical protein